VLSYARLGDVARMLCVCVLIMLLLRVFLLKFRDFAPAPAPAPAPCFLQMLAHLCEDFMPFYYTETMVGVDVGTNLFCFFKNYFSKKNNNNNN
jgi:hypothetical protein